MYQYIIPLPPGFSQLYLASQRLHLLADADMSTSAVRKGGGSVYFRRKENQNQLITLDIKIGGENFFNFGSVAVKIFDHCIIIYELYA